MRTRRGITAVLLAGAIAAPLGARGVSDNAVSGAYVEARTAEVFTGGCIMNSEAAMGGHEALLAWKVDRGSIDGVSLEGLTVVAAVAGDSNLGIREIGGEPAHTRSAMFVDERATPEQRTALVAMAKQLSNGLIDAVVDVTPTKIQFVDEAGAIRVSVQKRARAGATSRKPASRLVTITRV